MNFALMLAFNNSSMTRAAVESVFAQSIPTNLVVVENGSGDDSRRMLRSLTPPEPHTLDVVCYDTNTAPTIVANRLLANLFAGGDHILCMANDLVLPSDFHAELLKWPRGIVAASEIKDRAVYDDYITHAPPTEARSENTPMACMLLRKWLWDAVIAKDGYFFDENIFGYASDCDLALRVAACGIRGVQLSTPYWHYGSAALKSGSRPEQMAAMNQADQDRAYFKRKWGFGVADYEYGACAVDINFKGEAAGSIQP